MSTINIWYKKNKTTNFFEIKRWVNKENNEPIVSWDNDITNKLFEFNLKLYNPLDSEGLPFIPNLKDEIAITDHNNNILFNIFFGSIVNCKTEPKGRNSTNTDDNHLYILTIKHRDFSTGKTLLEKINSSYINDVLPLIFANTPFLGGTKINGYNIPKHDYGGANFLLPPFRFYDSNFNLAVKILDFVGWGFNYWFTSELSPTNGLNVYKSLNMYPKNSGRSIPDDWIGGITDQTWKNPLIENIAYPVYDDFKYIIAEDKLSTEKSNEDVVNHIELKCYIKTVTEGEGQYREILAESGKTVYDIGGSFNIKSICIKKIGSISSVISTTVFKLNSTLASEINYYQVRMNDNSLGGKMRCKITSGSSIVFSNFSINISTEEFTLETPISPLSTSDDFELVNCFDILPANLTSYPVDLNGYIIQAPDIEKSTITFTEFDAPEAVLEETTGDKRKIVIYYYPIKSEYLTKKDPESINDIGYKNLEETIKEPITPEQAQEVFNEFLKRLIDLQILDVKVSHRKNILHLNSLLPTDFKGMKGKYTVIESRGAILSEYGRYRNKPLITQQLKIANRKWNIDDVLGKIKNQSIALANLNLTNTVDDIERNVIRFREVLEGGLEPLITPILTSISDITPNSFIVHLFCSNTSTYLLDIATTPDFSSGFISQNRSLTIIANPAVEISLNISQVSSYSYPVYVRIRAIRDSEIGVFSNSLTVSNGLVNDFVLPSGKTFQYHLDSSSMVGSGTSLTSNDTAHLTASTNCSWVTDSQFEHGLEGNTTGTHITVQNSSNYRDQNQDARVVQMAIIELKDDHDTKVISSIYNGYGAGPHVQNQVFRIYGNKLMLDLYCRDDYMYNLDVVADMSDTFFQVDTKYAVAYILDLPNNSLKFIINQNTYSYNSLSSVTLASFKAYGGLNTNADTTDTTLTVMRENANYYSAAANMKLYRFAIQANTSLLTENQIKTMFANMGFT